MPGCAQNLHTVGEVGTVKIKTDTTLELEDHSVYCLFVATEKNQRLSTRSQDATQ